MLRERNALATVAVKDLEAARRFYEGTLGLEHNGPRRQGMLTYKSGSSLILVYVSTFAGTNKATSASWDAGNEIDSIVEKLREKGVTFEHYTLPDTVLEGDVHVAGQMRTAWFKDPDGNILNLFSGSSNT